MRLKTVLAINPIFPRSAVESRIGWAGLDVSDFEYITTYENSWYCKPNPEYYNEILSKLNLQSGECPIVGNDVTEDMVAQIVRELMGISINIHVAALNNLFDL